jgi:hypothetical protein
MNIGDYFNGTGSGDALMKDCNDNVRAIKRNVLGIVNCHATCRLSLNLIFGPSIYSFKPFRGGGFAPRQRRTGCALIGSRPSEGFLEAAPRRVSRRLAPWQRR